MIYEQLKDDVSQLTLLESNRGFRFVREDIQQQAFGDVLLESPDFRIKIVCEGGWAYADIGPLCEDRWVEASSVFAYLDKEVSIKYPYTPLALPNQLARINEMYEKIADIMKSEADIQVVEQLGKRRIEEFLAALSEPKGSASN